MTIEDDLVKRKRVLNEAICRCPNCEGIVESKELCPSCLSKAREIRKIEIRLYKEDCAS